MMQSESSSSPKMGYIIGGVVVVGVLGVLGYLTLGRKSSAPASKTSGKTSAAASTTPADATKLASLNVSGDAVLKQTTIGGADGTPIPILRWARQAQPVSSSGEWTVEFGYTFAQPPMVLLGVPEFGKPDYMYVAHLSAVTRSSFTYRFFFFDNINRAPTAATLYRCPDAHVINWMVIGQ